jgi:uroporphyrinogen decarboxylase
MYIDSRTKIRAIFDRRSDGTGAIWTGHPNDATIPICAAAFGIEPTREAIFSFLQDDCRWIIGDLYYRHPENLPMFDTGWGVGGRKTLSAGGSFANAEVPSDLDDYPWPDVRYLDLPSVYAEIDRFPDKMVFTGMWCPFFHVIADFFGMENYFILMHENPRIVDALTERVVDFYVEANERFFAGLGERADTMFFGNDFGTQLDLFLSPELFRRFVLPSLRRLIAIGKKYGKKVMLHSCGSIHRVIPELIEAGVDVLHPIQAGAHGMSANELSQYKNDLAFVGGIDAQTFFVNATPIQIKDEVRRVRSILGPNLVVSPSHEEVLPNVPAANLLAMAEAARE